MEIKATVTSLAEVWIETRWRVWFGNSPSVTSLAEVWIETDIKKHGQTIVIVTSLAEVWIETRETLYMKGEKLSLPLRKCGLKLKLIVLTII